MLLSFQAGLPDREAGRNRPTTAIIGHSLRLSEEIAAHRAAGTPIAKRCPHNIGPRRRLDQFIL
jgi:hypothetical protein